MTNEIKAPVWKRQVLTYAHAKHDGWQMRVRKDPLGLVTIKSRNTKDYYHKLKFCKSLMIAVLEMPRDTEVWGELWCTGEPASFVSSAIKHEDERLRFDAFCSPSLAEDMPLGDVRLITEGWGYSFLPFYALAGTPIMGAVNWFNDVNHLPIGGDIEGYVLKDGNMLNWYKFKPSYTIDLIITGYTEGRGKNEGLIGSLICSTVEGYEVANVGGMDEDTREEISCREQFYLGKVVEVEYQYAGAKGRLRHPRFVRFRDDKLQQECTCDQDQQLRLYYQGDA